MTASSKPDAPAPAAPVPGAGSIGRAEPRVDGRLKVTGAALYPADVAVANAAYAYLVMSSIARGDIVRIDTQAAHAIPGVLAIYTHENMRGRIGSSEFAPSSVPVMQDVRIWHAGQIVAMVVADRYETAREAAREIRIEYREDDEPAGTLDSARAETRRITELDKGAGQIKVGDVAAALSTAAFVHEALYETSPQHHNTMELFSTTSVWSGKKLTLYEPSGWVYSLANGVSQQLRIDRSDVCVVSPFIGGSFGSKGGITARTSLVALAARDLKRPVKLVLTRQQGYTITVHRAETRHRVKLGADSAGRLTAYSHETWEATSRTDLRSMNGVDSSARMYGWRNVETLRNVVRLDRSTPGSMRAPPEAPVMFALESALDEMAWKAGMDPVELRRLNDTRLDPVSGKPFSTRSLIQCYEAAAKAFGWAQREPKPGSMRDGDWQIGWGCATAIYPAYAAAASARVRVTADGHALVQVASQDVGTGAYTVITQIAAEKLGLDLARVSVELGDSRLPPAPYAGGSMTTAVVGSAVAKACDAIRARLGRNEDVVGALARMNTGAIEEVADWVPDGADPNATRQSYAGRVLGLGPVRRDALMFSFGAEFVEVRINVRTHEIRVPRVVGAFAAGRIVNPRTARSQLMGGMIWGISSALHERSEVDPRSARYVNANFAEYLVPVNADIGTVEVILIPEVDTQVNPLGIKGIGELGNVGTDAAVANAVFHATGRRVRRLPMRIEDVMTGELL